MMVEMDFRVTSVYQYDKKIACFSGVPLQTGSFKADSAKQIVMVKTIPDILPLEPTIGQHWRITGDMKSHQAVHGDFIITELRFDQPKKLEVTLPHDGESFIRFISKEPDFIGIGEVKARELWATFGPDIFVKLDSGDTEKLASVLTAKSIEYLIEGYRKYANLKYSTWFADKKIPFQVQQKLFKYNARNGDQAINAIKDNPYHLITFGMSFEKVDRIARDNSTGGFGLGVEDDRRLIAVVEFSLKKHAGTGGHTVARQTDIQPIIKRLLKGDVLTAKALMIGRNKHTYILDERTGYYHHTALLIMERVVAKRLLKLNGQKIKFDHQFEQAHHHATHDLPFPLAKKQELAVITSLKNSVSCITGGGGTGKTTVLRAVLKGYNAMGYDIKAIALAGRAAKRLHDSIGFATSTIAKFLRDDPIEDNKTIVVIDEASMVDLPTMYRIVIHTSPNVRFLFVGDPNQLPPIGCGLILADIVKSAVIPTTELDIVQRQDASTGIPEYSRMICLGEIPPQISVGHIHFHETSLDNVSQRCLTLYAQAPGNSRIIAATKKTVNEINWLCQSKLNNRNPRLDFQAFGEKFKTDLFLNDPVLFTQNNFEAEVQNGTLGQLISVEQTYQHYGIVEIEDDGRQVPLTRALLDSLEPGYCITLHKAQGSQFNRVIVALTKSRMLDRAWLYTAITRAEAELHIVGSRERFEQAVRSLSAHHIRQTHLATLLASGTDNYTKL